MCNNIHPKKLVADHSLIFIWNQCDNTDLCRGDRFLFAGNVMSSVLSDNELYNELKYSLCTNYM